MGSFSMGLAQMVADECAIENEKKEVSDEKAEQMVDEFNQMTDDDLDKRIQSYIDSKLSNDRFDLVSELMNPVEDDEPEKEYDTEKVSSYFVSLTDKNQRVCAEFYEQLKDLLPDGLRKSLDEFVVIKDVETPLNINEVQKALDSLNLNVKVVEHLIKFKTPCLRVDFDTDVSEKGDKVIDSVSDVMDDYGYVLQSKRKNSLYYVK